MKLLLFLISIIFLLGSCSSVEKYNAQISKLHSPTELKEDVDFAYEKLQKLHPNLYQYISKENLDNNFNNLKTNLTQPLSSIEFFKQIAPVISSIGQGHTSIYSPHKRQSKKEIKKTKGKRRNPFKTIRFTTLNDKIYIAKGFEQDSTITVGDELLEINNETVPNLLASFKNLFTGDGFNKTFASEYAKKKIGTFYNLTHKQQDTIQLTLKNKDSIYKKYIYAYEKKAKIKKDSITKKKLSKVEKKLAKKKKKAEDKKHYKYGYNKISKENTLNVDFIKTKDSTKTIAYMKIRNFMKGDYKEFFEESFKEIDSLKINHLIIDIRNNTGGRLSEIADLYAYLTTDYHHFIRPGKMTKPNSFSYPTFHNKSTLLKKVLTPITFPIAKVIQVLKVKKIDGEPHYIFKNSKLQKPKKEHNFKGKIYVLINSISFSASSILANKLQATKRALLVGDETGGAYNSTVAGRFSIFELPNSKNYIRSGLMVLETHHKTTPDGYGVKPDKYIKVTTLDKDEQLDWILKNIETND